MEIWKNSRISYSSNPSVAETNDEQTRPSPPTACAAAQSSLSQQVSYNMAQGDEGSVTARSRFLFRPTSHQAVSVIIYSFDHREQLSESERTNQFSGESDRLRPEKQSQSTNRETQERKARTLSFRSSLFPLSNKIDEDGNQSLTMHEPKPSDQLLQPFHTRNLLFSFPLTSPNDVKLFTTRISPPCFSSFQLIEDLENIQKKRANYRSLDSPKFLILAGDYVYRMDYERFIKAHRETNVDIILASLLMDEKRATAFGPMKIELAGRNYKEGDDQYLLEGLKCLSEYTIEPDIWVNNATLMYHLSEAFNSLSLKKHCQLLVLENVDKLDSQPGNVSLVECHPVNQWVSFDFGGSWLGVVHWGSSLRSIMDILEIKTRWISSTTPKWA